MTIKWIVSEMYKKYACFHITGTKEEKDRKG